MCLPSGDHAGSSTFAVPVVSCRAEPSATVTTNSCCTPSCRRSTASRFPSGDHDTRPPEIAATRRTSVPSAFAVHTADSCPVLRVNANDL